MANTYAIELTVDSSLVSATRSGAVIMARLDDCNIADFWSNVKSDGGDIRIYNQAGTVQYPVEISEIDTIAETGVIYFYGPVSSTVDTVYRLECGDSSLSQPAVTDTYGRNAVWTEFEAVWHLTESASGTGTTGLYVDSTGNGYDGDDYVSDTGKTGKVGKGQQFDGTDDYINISQRFTSGAYPATVMAWIHLDTIATNGARIFDSAHDDPSGINYYFGMMIEVNSAGAFHIMIGDGDGAGPNDRRNKATANGTIATGTTYHVAAIARGNTDMSIYRNGVDMGGTYSGNGTGWNNGSTANTPRIGYRGDYGPVYTDGWIDEVWFSLSDLGANYIATLYNNMNSPQTYITYAVAAVQPSPPTPFNRYIAVIN